MLSFPTLHHTLPSSLLPPLQRLTAVGLGWVPTLGNLLTLTAAVLGLALNMFLTSGSPEAVFMLAPLLLLLSADPLLLPGLAERKRYFPPAAAISSYLLVQCMGQVWICIRCGSAYGVDAEWHIADVYVRVHMCILLRACMRLQREMYVLLISCRLRGSLVPCPQACTQVLIISFS